MMKKDYSIYKAFTLAEVLITLGIIGVVCIMTIPTLINNIQDKQLKTSWRKIYSDLMNAQQKMVAENGSVEDAFDDITSNTQGGENLKSGWLKYLSYNKVCSAGHSVSEGCWYSPVKYYDNTDTWNGEAQSFTTSVILNNGMLLLFYPGMTGEISLLDKSSTTSDTWIFVDINGFKPPNTFGKDVFGLNYNPKKAQFLPRGDGSTCSGNGFNCSSYILME